MPRGGGKVPALCLRWQKSSLCSESTLHHFAGRDFGMAWGRRLLQTAVRFTCGCHILEALADVGTGTAAEAFVAGTLFSKVVEH